MGLVGTTVYGCAQGSTTGDSLWKGYVTGAAVGAAIGGATPV